jgi:hypothetical protein
MGIGMLLPALLSAIFGGLSLWKQGQSTQTVTEAAKPGAQPGTRAPGDPLFAEDQTAIRAIDQNPYAWPLRDIFNRGAELTPQATTIAAQMSENQRAGDVQRGYADRIVGIADKSRLGTLAPEVSAFRSDALERLDAQKANSAAARGRAGQTETTRDELLGRIQGTEKETGDYFRAVRDNPTIFSSNEIEAMASKYAEGNMGQAGVAQAGLEDKAARLGLSGSALAALQLQGESGQARDVDQYRRDLVIANARERAGRADTAAGTLATLTTALSGTEAGVGTTYTGLAEDQYGRGDAIDKWINETRIDAANKLFGTEAGIVSGYDDQRTRALALRSELEQPENLALIGSILDEVNRYNTQGVSGAQSEEAQSYASMMNMMMQLYDAQASRGLQRDLEPSSWDRFLSGGGANAAIGGGSTVGTFAGLQALGFFK